MSRVGKKEIIVPKDVTVFFENESLIVKGTHGLLQLDSFNNLQILISENKIQVLRVEDSKKSRALHGLTRALIQNMVLGVHQKFSQVLIVEGIGYKFQVDKGILILNMGYSHPVELKIPENLNVKLDSSTKISIFGIDKQKVGLFASEIRKIRPPEPYKGKGIRYEKEIVLRKAGKTGK
jgi:large subunit ribosomal protein L6